jgi:hypothetical protein
MPYLYRFTISYYAHSPRSTRTPIVDYFYKVYSPRRLSSRQLRARRLSLQKRTVHHLVRGRLKKRGFKAVHERTSAEAPRATRRRKKIIEAETIRYRKGKPVREQLKTTTYGKKRRKK